MTGRYERAGTRQVIRCGKRRSCRRSCWGGIVRVGSIGAAETRCTACHGAFARPSTRGLGCGVRRLGEPCGGRGCVLVRRVVSESRRGGGVAYGFRFGKGMGERRRIVSTIRRAVHGVAPGCRGAGATRFGGAPPVCVAAAVPAVAFRWRGAGNRASLARCWRSRFAGAVPVPPPVASPRPTPRTEVYERRSCRFGLATSWSSPPRSWSSSRKAHAFPTTLPSTMPRRAPVFAASC